MPIRVLIVDDSPLVRRILAMGFSMDPEIEVMGTAASATEAWAMMQASKPDVITLDVEMPATDGVTFLTRFMPVMPVPTVVLSALTGDAASLTLQAMEAGAVDVIEKPAIGTGEGLPLMMGEICERVRAAALARPRVRDMRAAIPPRPTGPMPDKTRTIAPPQHLIAIGSSTGGVQALHRILPMFPEDSPPIVIVQHMPAGFTRDFARRLDGNCAIRVSEAEDGCSLENGCAYIAPGGEQHMIVQRKTHRGLQLALIKGDPVCFSRPSVDVMFRSVAQVAGRETAAALLTGMGRDGAAGLLAINRAGGRTFAQDEASSVVYGMPLAAAELGAAQVILPLDDIPDRIIRSFGQVPAPRVARL